jgi:16S rRNA (cytosine1402-N4)-methyltransferase
MGEGHLPVLVDEVLASLEPGPGSSVADCTVGGGGHAERLLEASSPDGRLLGLDADQAAVAEARRTLERFGERAVLRHANFASLHDVAVEEGFVPLDAVLFDLGLSSYQLADPSRGFGFAADAPPDMRFDEAGEGPTALDLIDRSTQRELTAVLATFGEERHAGRVAKAILAARAEGRLVTAADLAGVVAAAIPRRGADAGRIHPATRTFQAVRIAVNRELEALGIGLEEAVQALRPGGRLAVISYHSGEDRIVKRFIARESRDCIEDPLPPVCTCGHRARLRPLTKGVITPSAEEVRGNRRARSARLRVATRLEPASPPPSPVES